MSGFYKQMRALGLVGLLLAAPGAGAAEDGGPRDRHWSLFGTSEVANRSLEAFSKWTGMLDRHKNPARQTTAASPLSVSGECRPNPRFPCPQEVWQNFLDAQSGRAPRDKIEQINLFINRARYIVDPINWGVPDYWATPIEFRRKDGDCEDYAIAKYSALQELGFDPKAMRIVVLQDENLAVAHAVLALEHEGDLLILDNQVDQVLTHTAIRHYRPIYSINEQAWWLHQGWQ